MFFSFLDTTLTPLHSRPCIWTYSSNRGFYSSNFGRGEFGAWARQFGTSVEERSLCLEEACVFVELPFYTFFGAL